MEFGVRVGGEGEGREAVLLHPYPEFLVQFADQRLFRPLPVFHLATRKFP